MESFAWDKLSTLFGLFVNDKEKTNNFFFITDVEAIKARAFALVILSTLVFVSKARAYP
jgi:hypothetical protein